jgi:hypothetical protein
VFDLTVLVLPDDSVCLYWSILSFYRSCLVEGRWEEPVEIGFYSATASFVPATAPDGEVISAIYQPPNLVVFGEQILNEDDGAADVRFLVDAAGGYQVFWRNFMEGQGLVWRRSTDGGATWSDHQFLSGDKPLGEMSVGIDQEGLVHLVWGFSNHVFHREWSQGSGWGPIEEVEVPTSIMVAAMAPDGRVIVVGRNAGDNFSLTRSAGGKWGEPVPLVGTKGRNLDQVSLVSSTTGDVEVMWHEVGAEFYNQTTVSGDESFAGSVPTPGDVNLDPVVVAASAAITAGTLLLVPIPAELLNGTLAVHHDEIAGWFRRRRPAPGGGFWQKPIGVVIFIVASALLFGFLDPGFGLNGDSVPTFLGLLLGVVVTTIGFALPLLVMRRAAIGEWGRVRALPVAMVVGIACVVLSRFIGFQPGYLYGIVLGTVFITTVGPDQEGREAAVTASLMLALTIAAWLMLGTVRSREPGFGSSVLETTLVTILVAGIEALAIGLVPLRGLPGRALAARNRWLWLALWGVSVFLFFHVLVNPESGYLADTALVPLSTTVALMVLFGVVSVGLWSFFALKDRRRSRSPAH